MIDWIIQNKEWIFSGIGAVFLAGIFGWLFKRKPPPAATDSDGSSARFSDIRTREGGVDIQDETGDPMDVEKIDAHTDFKVKRSSGGKPSPK